MVTSTNLPDYFAKSVKDDHKSRYKLSRIYEFKFADGKTDRFVVIGTSE